MNSIISSRTKQPWGKNLLLSSAMVVSLSVPAINAAAQDSTVDDEVIVTVQKRAQDITDVPISISAFSGELLEEKSINDVTEIARFTPGFTGSTFSAAEPILSVRGANNTFSQAGASKPVGVFLDDVFISRNSGSAFELYDLEQVTVLKGPQGTLFGRNVTGGAINITTSKPSLDETVLKGEVGYGNYDAIEVKGLASGPIAENVGAKISAAYRTRDGFGEDRLSGHESSDLDTLNLRGQLLFEPSDRLDALLTVDYSEDENGGRTLSALTPDIAPNNNITVVDDGNRRTTEHGIDQFFDRDTFGISARVNYDLDFAEFTSITAYRESDVTEKDSFTPHAYRFLINGFFPYQRVNENTDSPETLSQEFRLVSDNSGPVNYVLGLYYFDESISRQAEQTHHQGITGNLLRDRNFDQDVDTKSYAAYTDIELALSEFVKVNVGGRYTDEEKTVQVDFTDALNMTNNFSSDTFKANFSEFTPRAVITVQPSDDLTFYGSYTEGFTAGGFNSESDNEALNGVPFDPESVEAFELGMKAKLWDNRVRLNASVFQQDYKDKQEGLPNTNNDFVIVNASAASIDGFEFDATVDVTDNLSLFGSYSHLDATYDDFITFRNEDRSGNSLATSPEHSAAVGGSYSIALNDEVELLANASYAWQDEYFTGSSNQATFLIPDYGLLDASLGFEAIDERWKVTFWGKNLTDKDYLLVRSDFAGGRLIGESLGAPATYGVRLGVKY